MFGCSDIWTTNFTELRKTRIIYKQIYNWYITQKHKCKCNSKLQMRTTISWTLKLISQQQICIKIAISFAINCNKIESVRCYLLQCSINHSFFSHSSIGIFYQFVFMVSRRIRRQLMGTLIHTRLELSIGKRISDFNREKKRENWISSHVQPFIFSFERQRKKKNSINIISRTKQKLKWFFR